VTEQLHDVAHIGHAELLTPRPDESLRFFVDVLGMEQEARDGQSVFLRGWGDYLRYSLKLTESEQAGLGHMAARGARRRSGRGRDRATGRGLGWIDGDVGHGRAYRFTDRTATSSSSSRAERHRRSTYARGATAQRYVGRGAAVKRLDHVNVLAADVRANSEFAQELLGYRLYERIERDDGSEAGAWLSLSIAAHELIYVADAYGANGRLHHLAFWVDTREGACAPAIFSSTTASTSRQRRPSARDRAGLLSLRLRAGRQPGRSDDRRLLRLRPRLRAGHVDGSRARPRLVLGRPHDRASTPTRRT
jgi:catechol 2,3-dioxygenase